jgi:hypothetical protein
MPGRSKLLVRRGDWLAAFSVAMKAIFLFLACVALIALPELSGESQPPRELFSPDGRHSVKMIETALPGSDPDGGFLTLSVRAGERVLSQFPTEGYLIDAFWSPDGRYVAVDNRRANSGDYLWVFSLGDGRAIKKPVDAGPQGKAEPNAYEHLVKSLLGRVTERFPALNATHFLKLFVFAHGWTKSSELQVKTNLGFDNLKHQIVAIWETYQIKNDKLILQKVKIQELPWPPPAREQTPAAGS